MLSFIAALCRYILIIQQKVAGYIATLRTMTPLGARETLMSDGMIIVVSYGMVIAGCFHCDTPYLATQFEVAVMLQF